MAVSFARGEDKYRLIKAIDAKNKSLSELLAIAALRAGIYTDSEALDMFFGAANSELSLDLLETFIALLTDSETIDRAAKLLADFTGTLYIDDNMDLQYEFTVQYEKGRPYQKEAVTAVCDAITNKHRKMLIVQATGSGKTRVSISIVDVLRRHNYVKNILFLADRTALVKQAKNNYTTLLPDLSCCNLLDNKDDPENSRMIFSTYPTMMNAIDEKKNQYGEM